MNLKEFVDLLEKKGKLKRITKEVDPIYEVAALMDEAGDNPLYLENVKGSLLPCITNICSSRELVALALECTPNEIISKISNAINNLKEPKIKQVQEYKEIEASLENLPILTHQTTDGGPYIASAMAVAHDPEFGRNISFHRAMKIDSNHMVMRILDRHLKEYMDRGLKEFAFCNGVSVPVLLGSATSFEIESDEMAVANALADSPVIEIGGHLVPESEVVMICEFTGKLHDEGSFLDLTETPDIIRKGTVIKIKKIFVRDDSIFHALLPSGPEHKVLMGMPREPTIYNAVDKVVDCHDVFMTHGGGSWLHGIVAINKKNENDGMKAIEAAFGGHASMKHVWIVDPDIDITNPQSVEWAMATRFQGNKNLIVKTGVKGSSLDPSSNPETRETVKVGFDCTIPLDREKADFMKPKPGMKVKLEDYLD
jgi:2,5-furandicarboxylate decarboxylase 1